MRLPKLEQIADGLILVGIGPIQAWFSDGTCVAFASNYAIKSDEIFILDCNSQHLEMIHPDPSLRLTQDEFNQKWDEVMNHLPKACETLKTLHQFPKTYYSLFAAN